MPGLAEGKFSGETSYFVTSFRCVWRGGRVPPLDGHSPHFLTVTLSSYHQKRYSFKLWFYTVTKMQNMYYRNSTWKTLLLNTAFIFLKGTFIILCREKEDRERTRKSWPGPLIWSAHLYCSGVGASCTSLLLCPGNQTDSCRSPPHPTSYVTTLSFLPFL